MTKLGIDYTPKFKRHFKARILQNPLLLELFNDVLEIFMSDPNNPVLRTHMLQGSMKRFYAFSINEDYRVIFRFHKDKVLLYDIGTHSQIYRK